MADGNLDVLQTLPARSLRPDERDVVAEWLAVARDIASAYVSQRQSGDPEIYSKVVIIEEAGSGPSYLIYTPANREIWIVMHIGPPVEVHRFDSLRGALNFVRPVLSEKMSEIPLVSERRRAGRIAHVSPTLMPLMRAETGQFYDDEVGREDASATAVGIAVSILLSGLIWAMIGCVLHFS